MGLIALFCLGLVLAWGVVVLATGHWLAHPPRRTYANAIARGRPGDPGEVRVDGRALEFRAFSFASRGSELPAWDIAGFRADGPVVVFTHGWGDSRVGALSRVAGLVPHCSRIVVWDMPGQGEAKGVCELGAGEVEDLVALVRVVDDRKAAPGSARSGSRPLVLMGSSMGAGVSIVAAAKMGDAVDGVIAEAPYREVFTPARNVLRNAGLPWRGTLRLALKWVALVTRRAWSFDEFDRAVWASRLACPLLVIHGSEDDVSPGEDGRAIAGACGQGRFEEIAGAGHHGMWTKPATAEVAGRVVGAWLEELRRAEAGGDGRIRAD